MPHAELSSLLLPPLLILQLRLRLTRSRLTERVLLFWRRGADTVGPWDERLQCLGADLTGRTESTDVFLWCEARSDLLLFPKTKGMLSLALILAR